MLLSYPTLGRTESVCDVTSTLTYVTIPKCYVYLIPRSPKYNLAQNCNNSSP